MTTTTTSRPLRGPMLIPPAEMLTAIEGLPTRTVGALMMLAAAFWPRGELPSGAKLGAVLGIRRSRAEAMLPELLPFFSPGGIIHTLRSAAVAKQTRRAKAGRKGAAALHRRGGARRSGRGSPKQGDA